MSKGKKKKGGDRRPRSVLTLLPDPNQRRKESWEERTDPRTGVGSGTIRTTGLRERDSTPLTRGKDRRRDLIRKKTVLIR